MSAIPNVQSPQTTTTSNSNKLSLSPTDFINMMVTQLKNQDPLSPTSSQDLLQQMSQIGQLQSSTTLQNSLTSMVAQNQIASSSSMIGKQVSGIDATNQPVSGVVSSVTVDKTGATLQLSDGSALPVANISTIAKAAAA